MVKAPGNPADTCFLQVFQAADAVAPADATPVIQTSAGMPFAGALVGTRIVLFPVSLNTPATTLTYTVPTADQSHLVTGLQSNGTYDIVIQVWNRLTESSQYATVSTHRAGSGVC